MEEEPISLSPPQEGVKKSGFIEIFATLFITVGALFFLASSSLQMQLSAGKSPKAEDNLIGSIGHYSAEYLFFLFGKSSFLLGPYLFLLGLIGIYRGGFSDPLSRLLAALTMMVATSMLGALFFSLEGLPSEVSGGLVGAQIGTFLQSLFGHYGAIIIAIGILLLGISLAIRVPMPIFLKRTVAILQAVSRRYVELFSAPLSMQFFAEEQKAPPIIQKGEKRETSAPWFSRVIMGEEPVEGQKKRERDNSEEEEGSSYESSQQEKLPQKLAQKLPVESLPHPEASERETNLPEEERGDFVQQELPQSRGRLDGRYLDIAARTDRLRTLLERLNQERSATVPTADSTITDESDVTDNGNMVDNGNITDESSVTEENDLVGQNSLDSLDESALMDEEEQDQSGNGEAGSDSLYSEEELSFQGYFSDDENRFHFRNSLSQRAPQLWHYRYRRGRLGKGYLSGGNLMEAFTLNMLEEAAQQQIEQPEEVEQTEEDRDRVKPPAEERRQRIEPITAQQESIELPAQYKQQQSREEVAQQQIEQPEEIEQSEEIEQPEEIEQSEEIKQSEEIEQPEEVEQTEEDRDRIKPPAEERHQRVEPITAQQESIELPAQYKQQQSREEAAEQRENSGSQYEESFLPGTGSATALDKKFPSPKSAIPFIEIKGGSYFLPRNILRQAVKVAFADISAEVEATKEKLEQVIRDYGVNAYVVRTQRGPIITLYELKLEAGTKVARIVGIQNEICMNLEAASVRILAPVPGKATVGIEVPNKSRQPVLLSQMFAEPGQKWEGELRTVLGKDISGQKRYADLTRLPHLLIAGATGSGKSVYLNSVIASLLYSHSPEDVRFLMIDPKMVELKLYEGIPHLLLPVIVDVHEASRALAWLVTEMERRYSILSARRCRDIRSYNQRLPEGRGKMPYIVVIIDELSDLMMIAAKDVEDSIIRLTQKARAVGIHAIMATQRPSVDVITALIKANCPARVAFQVAQKTDSRTILDTSGAENLLGRGDLLYKSPSTTALTRIQAPLISEEEISAIVKATRRFGEPAYIDLAFGDSDEEDSDIEINPQLFEEAWRIVQESGKTSTSYLQRRMRIGYNRAANLIEIMEKRGWLSAGSNNRPREILKID